MKDIEAMKTKMLREIALAEFSNQMEETIGNPEIGVTAFDGIGKGAKRWVSIKQNNNYKPLTMKQAGEVLCKIARTGDTDVKGATRYIASVIYYCCIHKSPRTDKETIEIKYAAEECDVRLEMCVDTSSKELMQFFKEATRSIHNETDEVQSRWNWERLNNYRFHQWTSGKVVQFSGGYMVQTTNPVINSFIETIKYAYEYGYNK